MDVTLGERHSAPARVSNSHGYLAAVLQLTTNPGLDLKKIDIDQKIRK